LISPLAAAVASLLVGMSLLQWRTSEQIQKLCTVTKQLTSASKLWHPATVCCHPSRSAAATVAAPERRPCQAPALARVQFFLSHLVKLKAASLSVLGANARLNRCNIALMSTHSRLE
jgi:hypothetical protein